MTGSVSTVRARATSTILQRILCPVATSVVLDVTEASQVQLSSTGCIVVLSQGARLIPLRDVSPMRLLPVNITSQDPDPSALRAAAPQSVPRHARRAT